MNVELGTPPTIGFLGPGAMGTGMVSRLLAAGYTVNVFARNPGKIAGLLAAGAKLAATPAELVKDSGIVLGCLLDSAVIRELYLGPGGIADVARKDQVFVEHATFEPSLALEISAQLAARGAHFLDAPVSGGPAGALAGTLVSMVGGEPETIQRLLPILGSYSTTIKHAGPIGTGLKLKLINQLLVCTHAVVAAEASALVMRSGINPQIAQEALMGGWAASTMLDIQLPKACASDYASGGAAVGGLIEIQRLISAFVDEAGIRSAVLGPVRQVFDDSVQSGHGASGLASLVTQYLGPDGQGTAVKTDQEQSWTK